MKPEKLLKDGLMVAAGIGAAGYIVQYAKKSGAMSVKTASAIPLAAGVLLPMIFKGKQGAQFRPLAIGMIGVGIAALAASFITPEGEAPIVSIGRKGIGAGYSLVSRGNYIQRRPDLRTRVW